MKSLTTLSPENTKAMLQECMYRMDQAQKAYLTGKDEINVEVDESNDHESPNKLMREYISDEIIISITPIKLTLTINEVRICDENDGQLIHEMPSISYIGDDNNRHMVSYVVKEFVDGNGNSSNGEGRDSSLRRRCYVFQADCKEDLKKHLPEEEVPQVLNKQIKTIFTAFQDSFKYYWERLENWASF